MTNPIHIYKIGGSITDCPERLAAFINEFQVDDRPKILVHGGGKEATSLAKALGLQTRMIDGRRVTDAEMLRVVVMVYAGLINKRLVASLQSKGCNAIGLTGADGNLVRAVRRMPQPADFGFVGDISPEGVNVDMINRLLQQGLTPVCCAIAHDGDGTLLNCNADGVASALATALAKAGHTVSLRYRFELPGVLANAADKESVIGIITPSSARELKSRGVVSGGMLPKIDSALKALEKGVMEVQIGKTVITND